MKKAVIVYQNNTPVAIYEIKELTSGDFLQIQKECEANLKILQDFQKTKEKTLLEKVEKLEKEIKILKGEE